MPNTIINPEHPLWQEFSDKLSGPEGCNFRRSSKGALEWTCNGTFEYATAVLENMRAVYGDEAVDVEQPLSFLSSHGGYCDREILFNVEERVRAARRQ